jgi:hypothetical protein
MAGGGHGILANGEGVIDMKKFLRTAGLILPCFVIATSSVAGQTAKTKPGVLCVAVIAGFSAEVGKTCIPEYNLEGQARLQKQLARLESHILKSEGWDENRVEEFMKKQAKRGRGKDLCEFVTKDEHYMALAKGLINADAEALAKVIENLTQRTGPPDWGDCI